MIGAASAFFFPVLAMLIFGLVAWVCRENRRVARVVGAGVFALAVSAFLFMVVTGRFMASAGYADDDTGQCGGALTC